jgi:hypothetical protein
MYREEKKEYKEVDDKNKYLDTHHNKYVNKKTGGIGGYWVTRGKYNVIDEEVACIKIAKERGDDNKKKTATEDNKRKEVLNNAIKDSVKTLDEHFSRDNYMEALSKRVIKHLEKQPGSVEFFTKSVLEYKDKLPVQVTSLSNKNICSVYLGMGYFIQPSWYRHTYVYDPVGKGITGTAMEEKFPTAEFQNVWGSEINKILGVPARLAALLSLSATLKPQLPWANQVLEVGGKGVANIFMGRIYQNAVVDIITKLPTLNYQIEGIATAGQKCTTHTNIPAAYRFVGCNEPKNKMELCDMCLAILSSGSEKFAAKMCVGCFKKCKEKNAHRRSDITSPTYERNRQFGGGPEADMFEHGGRY